MSREKTQPGIERSLSGYMKKQRTIIGIVGAIIIIIIAVAIFGWSYALAFIDANGNRLQGAEALVALVVFAGGGLVVARRWLSPKRGKTPGDGSRLHVHGDGNAVAHNHSVAVGGECSGWHSYSLPPRHTTTTRLFYICGSIGWFCC